MKNRLDKAKNAGERAAQTALEARAKAAGFTSVDAMFENMQARRTGGGGQGGDRSRQGGNGGDRQNGDQQRRAGGAQGRDPKADREIERERKRAEDAERATRVEAKRRKDLQRKLDAQEATAALERIAVSKGIRDTSYAIHLLNQHLADKPEAEIDAFDEAKFFEGLRPTHAHLFGETVVPATTGTGGGAAGTPPATTAEETARRNAAAGQVDVMKMDPKQYEEHLKKRGINPNALQQ